MVLVRLPGKRVVGEAGGGQIKVQIDGGRFSTASLAEQR